jgi:hypothetical protein
MLGRGDERLYNFRNSQRPCVMRQKLARCANELQACRGAGRRPHSCRSGTAVGSPMAMWARAASAGACRWAAHRAANVSNRLAGTRSTGGCSRRAKGRSPTARKFSLCDRLTSSNERKFDICVIKRTQRDGSAHHRRRPSSGGLGELPAVPRALGHLSGTAHPPASR